jgi:hypothetical protein
MSDVEHRTLRLLTIGGWVREHYHPVRLRLASSRPGEGWWCVLATRHHPSWMIRDR